MPITSFKRFQLDEALDKPVKYYLTDDTVVPKKLYGAFEIDGMKYVMVMAQSKIPNVYYMELGRSKGEGSNIAWWKFHSPKHIIPALATLVSFSDSSLQLLGKDKFKGVAIKLRKSAATKSIDRAVSIASRIIKTKFNTRLEMLPISEQGTGNKHGEKFIFIARKGQSYANMFAGDSHFSSHDFKKNPAVSADDLEVAVKPKQVIKQTATTKPSSKYTFGQFDVDVPGDVDFEMLQRLKNVKPSDATDTVKKTPGKSTTPITDAYTEKLNAIPSDGISSKAAIVESLPVMKSMVNALKKYGFDQNKLNWGDLKYVIGTASKVEKALIEKAGLLNVDGPDQKVLWMSVMKKIAVPSDFESIKNKIETVKTLVKDFYLDYPNGKPVTVKPVPVSGGPTPIKGTKTANVKPSEFVSAIPGASTTEVVPSIEPPYWGTNENVEKQTQYIFYDLGYSDELKKIPNFRSMVSYTGSQYSSYNNPVRNVVGKLLKGDDLYAPEVESIVKNTSKFMRLAKMFEKVKPLPEGIWVYRGTYIPNTIRDQVEPGFQYADPAFLSTTLRSNLGFGSDKMRIYLPKGSKVLPVLGHSKHSTEKEIILPPSSIIKTLEVTRFDNSAKIYMQGIFMGTAYKSIVEELKKQLTKLSEHITMYQALQLVRLFEEMNKETEYDPEEKYGGSYDAELAELINKKIESGEYKVERPKLDEE